MNRRIIIYGILALFIFIGRSAYAQSGIIDEHFKALNAHDIKAIMAEYASNAQVFSPNWEGAKTSPEEIADVYTRYFRSTPDLAYTLINSINAGDHVIVEYSWTGTLSNPEQGTPDYMKGKKYTLRGCAIFEVKDNKIVKETNYFDQVAFLRQVGFFD